MVVTGYSPGSARWLASIVASFVLVTWTGLATVVVAQGAADLRLLPPIDSVVPAEVLPAGPLSDPLDGLPDTGSDRSLSTMPGLAVLDGVTYPPWASPFHWFAGPVWDGSLEVGMNGSRGNTDAISFRAGGSIKREVDANTLEILINYARNHQGNVETQNNGLLSGRWDWDLPSPSWIVFHRTQLEYDEFKAFDVRLTLALGLGYHFIDSDATKLTSRVGSAVSHEFGGPDDSWVPEANFGMDLSHQLTKRQSLKANVDYYPAWENLEDYRLVSQAHWQVLLDEESNLSFKVGAIDRYDSTSNGRRPNDIDYYLTLIWKL